MKLTLAERFLIVRRREGMYQRQLADMLGTSRETIYRIEGGKVKVGKRMAEIKGKFEVLEQRQRERQDGR